MPREPLIKQPSASDTPASPQKRPQRTARASIVRFGLLTVLVGALAGFMLLSGPDRGKLIGAVSRHSEFAPAVAVVGSALLTAAFVPRTLLSLVGGLLFGWLSGAGYVLLGITLGAIVAFLLGRLLGRDFVARKLRGRAALVDRAVAGRGVLAVVICRLIPLTPYGISNYVFGTTSMRFRPFVAGTLIGAAPATLAYAALGAATAHGNVTGMKAASAVVLTLGVLGTVGTYLVWRRRPKRVSEPPVAIEQ